MIIPLRGAANAPPHAQLTPSTPSPYHFLASLPSTEGWSSLIGIVTAIVGNILISFALNTQRLAHIRLERESNGQDPSLEQHNHEPGRAQEDHQLRKQSKLADEISRRNKQSKPVYQDGRIYTDSYHNHDGEDESSPLLKKVNEDVAQSPTSSERDSDEKDKTPVKKQNYLRSKLWWLGIILMTVGEAGNFLAYGFAPASVVSPLGVVALVVNCLIAPLMLHEKLRKRDPLGILVSVGGAVTVVLSAKGSNPKLGPDQIWRLVGRWEFLTYLGITVACIVVLMFLSTKYGQKTILIDIGLVGLFGGYTALSTKGVASLLSYRVFEVFTFGITYLLIAILVVTAVMQIKYVNRALQHFDSTQVIPTQFCTFTVFVVAGSAILYRDFESMTAAKVGQFFGGVALTFLGVWIITSGRRDAIDEDHDEEDQEIDMVDDESPVPSAQEPPTAQSPPSTPKVHIDPETPTHEPDTPASFATATSQLTPTATPNRKPPMTSATSSPLLPSQRGSTSLSNSASSRLAPPKTPTSASASNSNSNSSPNRPPYTPRHTTTSSSTSAYQTSQTTTAAATTPTPRQLLSRGRESFTGMLPGPYMSPLSSGLSVVVADSRRRDERASLSLSRRRSQRSSVPTQRPGLGGPLTAMTAGGAGGAASMGGVGQSQSQQAGSSASEMDAHRNSAPDAGFGLGLGTGGEASVTERPRLGGRGNTVEVAGSGVGLSKSLTGESIEESVEEEEREEEGDERNGKNGARGKR